MVSKKVLELLDYYVDEYDFPVLDNMNFDYSQGRITVFKEENKWLIVFEIIGSRGEDIEKSIYIYGDLVKKNGLILGIDDFIKPLNSSEWFDKNRKLVVNPYFINVSIKNKKIGLKLTSEDYKKMGINPKKFNLTKLIRTLSFFYKDDLWTPLHELLQDIGIRETLIPFYQTTEWKHPDITEDEKPSDTDFFSNLANGIERNDVNQIKTKNTNTNWKNWTWNDFDN